MHVVDAIAERFRELLIDATDAQDRVTRDRATPVDSREGLPSIDIRVGEEGAEDVQSNETYVGRVLIEVDLLVADAEENVSFAVLALRSQMHRAVFAGNWSDMGIRAAGATAIQRGGEGSVPTGSQTALFEVLFQHPIADPG